MFTDEFSGSISSTIEKINPCRYEMDLCEIKLASTRKRLIISCKTKFQGDATVGFPRLGIFWSASVVPVRLGDDPQFTKARVHSDAAA